MLWRARLYKISVGCVTIGDEEKRLVKEVLDSGWVSPGPKIREFEQKFANAHDCEFGVMVNSGTDALRIALATLKEAHGWKDGDEVIVPALTFVATVNVILQNNLKPVFVDVDPNYFNMKISQIASVRTKRTRAVIPVHMFGFMTDVYQLSLETRGLKIIEDSCETMGVRYLDGRENMPGYKGDRRNGSCGGLGDIGCFSTYACHLIVTGVGGIATTNNPDYAQLMRSYANHGRDPFFLGGYSQEDKKPSLELIQKRFLYHRVGYSSRVSEFEAALGIAQLDRLPYILRKRLRNATILDQLLTNLAWNRVTGGSLHLPQVIPVNRPHAFMMYPIVIKDKNINRDDLCLYLEHHGVETRPLMPLLTQPVYKQMWGDISKNYPIAHEATTRGFYVGCHQNLTETDLKYLARTLTNGVKALAPKAKIHAYA